jgi:hypothetical protein
MTADHDPLDTAAIMEVHLDVAADREQRTEPVEFFETTTIEVKDSHQWMLA